MSCSVCHLQHADFFVICCMFNWLLPWPQVPPLRVRPSDILDFERYFMKLISKEQGVRLRLTPEAERALLAYSFPDNITVSTVLAAGHTGFNGCGSADADCPLSRTWFMTEVLMYFTKPQGVHAGCCISGEHAQNLVSRDVFEWCGVVSGTMHVLNATCYLACALHPSACA